MWIVITAPFIDKLAEDPKDAEVPAGKKMNVTAERGQELIDLGLAEISDTEGTKPTKAEIKAGIDSLALDIAANSAADPGATTIAPGIAGPIDGHPAGEDITHD
ncbi:MULTISPECIES: hypothetical protein [unclassified Novosphingobium]|uniref:hypothetical protein n=1 Tax=unclassified Novosphingobium TaxID=2644732 RepID=UPI0013583AB7|nr:MULTISPECIES: hypothetical protein [unclassified Novosphingobium]